MFLNVHLNISEMYDNNDVSNGKEKLGFFFSITRYSHYPWSSAVLFENELGLPRNV